MILLGGSGATSNFDLDTGNSGSGDLPFHSLASGDVLDFLESLLLILLNHFFFVSNGGFDFRRQLQITVQGGGSSDSGGGGKIFADCADSREPLSARVDDRACGY